MTENRIEDRIENVATVHAHKHADLREFEEKLALVIDTDAKHKITSISTAIGQLVESTMASVANIIGDDLTILEERYDKSYLINEIITPMIYSKISDGFANGIKQVVDNCRDKEKISMLVHNNCTNSDYFKIGDVRKHPYYRSIVRRIKECCIDKEYINNRIINEHVFDFYTGFDKYGYDFNGYDTYGYDADGYNANGYDVNGVERCHESDKKGDVSHSYDEYGYDEYGYDKHGYNMRGRDKRGFSKEFYIDKIGQINQYILKEALIFAKKRHTKMQKFLYENGYKM